MTIFGTAVSGVLKRFAKNYAGATSIEYAFIAAGISIAIVASVSGLGSGVVALFTSVQGSF